MANRSAIFAAFVLMVSLGSSPSALAIQEPRTETQTYLGGEPLVACFENPTGIGPNTVRYGGACFGVSGSIDGTASFEVRDDHFNMVGAYYAWQDSNGNDISSGYVCNSAHGLEVPPSAAYFLVEVEQVLSSTSYGCNQLSAGTSGLITATFYPRQEPLPPSNPAPSGPVLLRLSCCASASGDHVVPGAGPGWPLIFWGSLSAQDLVGIPKQSVDLLVDGGIQSYASVSTDSFGNYSAALGFSRSGTHHVTAIAWWGTPMEVRSSPITVNVPKGLEAVAIASSLTHVCAVKPDGTVRCWGENSYGQLGDGTQTDRLAPVAVVGLTSASNVATGYLHTCAVVLSQVNCWGSNYYGQLGNSSKGSSTPQIVLGIFDAIGITAGAHHTCVLVSGGQVKCWGRNQSGQLGNGTYLDSSSPVEVIGISNATSIVAGLNHTCAIVEAGAIKCWGDNGYYQLGNFGWPNQSSPIRVLDVSGAVSVAGGAAHTCAALSGGQVKCWGNNTIRPQSVNVQNAASVVATDYGTCAIVSGGEVSCWDQYQTLPKAIPYLTGITKGAAGGIPGFDGATCMITRDGIVCWGKNAGDGSGITRFSPVAVKDV